MPIRQFSAAMRGEGYRRRGCKVCEPTRRALWYQDDLEASLKKKAQTVKRCSVVKRRHSQARRKKLAEYARRCRAKAKRECFEHYGGMKCACCGEIEPLFLTLDHIDSDRSVRQKYGGSAPSNSFYGFLRGMGYPKGFQVLCMNCNWGKARNGGVCPHRKDNLHAS